MENLRERVKKLEATFPFDHRDKLADEKWIEQKQNEIKESIATLTKEKRQWEMFIYSQTGLTMGEA